MGSFKRWNLGQRIFDIANSLYTGPIRAIAKVTGADTLLKRIRNVAAIRLTGSTEVTLSGHSIEFGISSITEFRRFERRDLMGEREIVEQLVDSLHPDDVFYDVGANVGVYTCFAAAALTEGETFGFEPEPENARRLRSNLAINDLDAEVIQAALSNRCGIAELGIENDQAGEGRHSLVTREPGETIAVPLVRVDTVVREGDLPPPTVVKIDVEGAELSVLEGMRRTLEEHCRRIYVEIHAGVSPGDEEDVRRILNESGFDLTEIQIRGDETFLRGTR